MRSPGVRSCRHAGLLLALLLALAAPAHGSQVETQAPEGPQSSVLDSSTVPAAANWVVLDVTGTAAWRAQGESRWRAFQLGEVLPPGCEIETGADGEVMLVAGGDQLVVAPHGRLIVPPAAPGQDRRLRHERGRILVHIESREDRDVRVDTPLLSLGIKGTNFEVDVDPEQNSVVVHDGEVQVTTPDQPDPVDLGAGEGLRQPAAPGSPATRFTLPEHGTGPANELGGRLTPAGTTAPQGPETTRAGTGAGAATAPARAVGGPGESDRAQASSSRAGTALGWLDQLASSWAFAAIAGVALVTLTIPVLVLLHNLREQWLDRTGAAGRRRRELIRG
jgi:FecR protein